MNIQNAQYTSNENTTVKITVDGKTLFVPQKAGNADYAEILRQVAAGTLTIQDAD